MTDSSVVPAAADVLGPVVNRFLFRLDSVLGACDRSDTRILMAMRAGLRIDMLYRQWRSARGQAEDLGQHLLRTSRMMGVKVAYATSPDLALAALQAESQNASTEELIRALLRSELAGGRLDETELGPIPDVALADFLARDNATARRVRDHLSEQSERYAAYLRNLADGAERLILIDSGWKGTTQLLLENAFPNHDWEGVYFGAIGRCELLGRKPKVVHGLMFDSTGLDHDTPETGFLAHRHLIESLFEPGIPSFEALGPDDVGNPVDAATLLAHERQDPWDKVFQGVLEYVRAHAGDPVARVMADHERAMSELARIMIHPRPEEVLHFTGKQRSFDLGREGAVPTVYPVEDRGSWDSPELRTRQAIWQTGQAALENADDPDSARQLQAEIGKSLGAAKSPEYFTAHTARDAHDPGTRVAIVTRTKNRPVLLRRAANSIASQTYDDYVWVVVNDGGESEPVDRLVAECLVDPTRIVVCHNAESLGMEGASNTGIAAVESDFIAIHDDDDTWEPEFLKKSVAFLRANAGVYKGVITGTTYVSEEISGNRVIEHARKPYNKWVGNVQLTEMAVGNFFAPIAFLFRRDIHDEIGGFDESLPVLGDWDFNLRFLLRGDIGVLPEPLANYHHRDRGNGGGTYSNSVIGGVDRHAAYTAIVRNKYIRLATRDPGYTALATALGAGFLQQDIRNRMAAVGEGGTGPQSAFQDLQKLNVTLQEGLFSARALLSDLLGREDLSSDIKKNLNPYLRKALAADPDTEDDLRALNAALAGLLRKLDVNAAISTPGLRSAGAGIGTAERPFVSWSEGTFKDNWIGVEAELSVYDTDEIELTLFLPLSDEHSTKKVAVFQDDRVLQEIEIERGRPNTVRLAPALAGGHGRLKLISAYAEPTKGRDQRQLGFVCLEKTVVEAEAAE